MKKYVTFVDVKTRSLTMTKGYSSSEEYLEIMDNIDPSRWEVCFE